MDRRLKHFLKWLKEQESIISMMLGALVVVAVGALIFSYYSDSRSAQINNSSATTAATSPEGLGSDQEVESQEPEGEYIVRRGDHLWKIAQTHYGSGYRHTDIAAANNINLDTPLFVGQRLKLPFLDAQREPVKISESENQVSQTPKEVPQKNSNDKNTYTVTRGDTLWSIAVATYQNGYRWMDIVESNPELITDPSLIEVGWVLKI
jgi:nucleoid-associated protein YgaU